LRGISIDEAQTEEQLKRVEAMILSMTPEERRHPKIINGSRRRRIAQGSGTEVHDVNVLLSQYRQMKKVIKRLNKGKMKGLSIPRLF
jgi:signal recognition particle subunit SRP54